MEGKLVLEKLEIAKNQTSMHADTDGKKQRKKQMWKAITKDVGFLEIGDGLNTSQKNGIMTSPQPRKSVLSQQPSNSNDANTENINNRVLDMIFKIQNDQQEHQKQQLALNKSLVEGINGLKKEISDLKEQSLEGTERSKKTGRGAAEN